MTARTAPAVTDCPAGVHDTREECDRSPWCPVDDPGCFGTRCDDHDDCGPAVAS